MSDPKKVAVYYPEIAIPDRKWLTQAVLYYDGVASIVPGDMQLWTQRQVEETAKRLGQIPEELAIISDDVLRLMDDGQYTALRPNDLFFGEDGDPDEFANDFLAALVSDRFQRSLGKREGWCLNAPIHRRKGKNELFELLIDQGYAKYDDDGEWVMMERSTAHLYMAVLAKHLAAYQPYSAVPSTSTDGSFMRDISFRIGENVEGVCIAEVLFKDVLPCPAPGTPMKDILAFKRKWSDELSRFRLEVSGLEEKLARARTAEEIKAIVNDFADKKNVGLAELQKAIKDAKFNIAVRSLESLVQIRSPALWLSLSALAHQAAKITDVPIPLMVAGAVTSGSVLVGATVASGLRGLKSKLEGHAFSYVHHVEEKLRPK
jgi:hypothetical protein